MFLWVDSLKKIKDLHPILELDKGELSKQCNHRTQSLRKPHVKNNPHAKEKSAWNSGLPPHNARESMN